MSSQPIPAAGQRPVSVFKGATDNAKRPVMEMTLLEPPPDRLDDTALLTNDCRLENDPYGEDRIAFEARGGGSRSLF
ncbi:MAG TPA: hypothetical protein VKV17_18005 [Bryobacteraceae bacterium]|nr:hypothetical protein [Bryobacteraceae bacterium]